MLLLNNERFVVRGGFGGGYRIIPQPVRNAAGQCDQRLGVHTTVPTAVIRFLHAAATLQHPSPSHLQVPELLFRPMDIGLQQAGVAEAVVQAVSAAHPALQPLLYTNVVLTGECGSASHSYQWVSGVNPKPTPSDATCHLCNPVCVRWRVLLPRFLGTLSDGAAAAGPRYV